jgi:PAS domain S-box-containing protein
LSQDRSREALVRQSSFILQFPQPALRLIYDTAPIGLAFLSPDCRYLQINQRLTEICGISVEDHLGRSVRDRVPALADSVESIVRSIVETGEPVTGIEVAGQRADRNGERFWITYWHQLRGPAGNIVGVNVAAEEITERKRAEAALRASEQELRNAKDAAENALLDLRETQHSLIEAEKLAALGRLVAGVAHEINSPVGTSLTVASSLERKCTMFAAEVARGELKRSGLNDFLDLVRDASSQLATNLGRAAELIKSFKQVAVDRSYLDQRDFDLGDLTKQVLMSLRSGLQQNSLALNVACQPDLTMNSYPGPYGQVLTNLFLNSVAHAFSVGEGGTVDIQVRAFGEDNVQIVFSDDGCGMSPDVRRQAFDPFFTTRRNEGSTGLGLHIVHNIVTNRLGGRINLDSSPGEGTKVQLILPRVAPTELPQIARPERRDVQKDPISRSPKGGFLALSHGGELTQRLNAASAASKTSSTTGGRYAFAIFDPGPRFATVDRGCRRCS